MITFSTIVLAGEVEGPELYDALRALAEEYAAAAGAGYRLQLGPPARISRGGLVWYLWPVGRQFRPATWPRIRSQDGASGVR
jgi:hypothetical protein